MKIICIGDSLMTGYKLSPEDSFVRQLDRTSQNDWVLRGIDGDTANGVLARLHADGLAQSPRAIFFLCGVNDIVLTGGWEQVRSCIMAIVHECVANNVLPVMGIPYLFRDIPPLWKPLCPPVEVLREAMKGYIYWLREFAAVTGVRHVDFARAFEEAQKAHPEEELFQEDGLHPTAAGCRLMADTVRATQSLKNLL